MMDATLPDAGRLGGPRLTTRDCGSLTPEMGRHVAELQRRWGLEMPRSRLQGIDAYRDPWDQARLFRRGHSRAEIVALQARLEAWGYPELSAILDRVGPQPAGARVTGAGPGEGWHAYGDAWDACPVLPSGRLAWDVRDEQDSEWELARRAWEVYGRLVAAVGLVWGGAWGDRPHCQRRPAESHPLRVLSRAEVEAWARGHGWW